MSAMHPFPRRTNDIALPDASPRPGPTLAQVVGAALVEADSAFNLALPSIGHGLALDARTADALLDAAAAVRAAVATIKGLH